MGLESTVLVLDNSEYMRNGDYSASRLESQEDAALLLANAKLNSNPESTVAVVSMGDGVEVKLTLTTDEGLVNAAVRGVRIASTRGDLCSSLQVSQLLLKNRQNTHGSQRIVLFVGSPVLSESAALVRQGKLLRKNNIAVDVVSFGEEAENASKLESFVGAVNKKVDGEDNSHLVTIPAGPHILSDILLTTPVFSGAFGAGGGGASGGGGFGGVDPNMDPELAAVLAESLREEEERRKNAGQDGSAGTAGAPGAAASSNASDDMDIDEEEMLRLAIEMSKNEGAEPEQESSSGSGDTAMADAEGDADEMDEEMRLALEMSKMEDEGSASAAATSTSTGTSQTGLQTTTPLGAGNGEGAAEDDDMDEEMRLALEMSKMEESTADKGKEKEEAEADKKKDAKNNTEEEDVSAIMENPEFLASLIGDLDGVDPSDPSISEILKGLNKDKEEKK